MIHHLSCNRWWILHSSALWQQGRGFLVPNWGTKCAFCKLVHNQHHGSITMSNFSQIVCNVELRFGTLDHQPRCVQPVVKHLKLSSGSGSWMCSTSWALGWDVECQCVQRSLEHTGRGAFCWRLQLRACKCGKQKMLVRHNKHLASKLRLESSGLSRRSAKNDKTWQKAENRVIATDHRADCAEEHCGFDFFSA